MADAPDSASTPAGSSGENSRLKDALAAVLGFVILLGFGLFIIYLLRNLGLPDTEWSRAIYLFAGVEAVAFTAAGYFFGTQVQRGRVEEAKKEAEAADAVRGAAEETAKAERRAARVLAEGVVASAGAQGGLMASSADPTDSALLAQARAILRD